MAELVRVRDQECRRFVHADVLVDVAHDDAVVREEVLGPVAPGNEWTDEAGVLGQDASEYA